MKTLLLILAFAVAVSAQAQITIEKTPLKVENYPDCTIRYHFGPIGVADTVNYYQLSTDTCWVGTPGFNYNPQVGAVVSDRALVGINGLIVTGMNSKKIGESLEIKLPNGNTQLIVKSALPFLNEASINNLVIAIAQNPMGFQVAGIYNFPIPQIQPELIEPVEPIPGGKIK